MLQLVQEDASVFEAFMKCYKMPKATDLEKELRQIKIQEAAKMAAEIPLKIGEKALAVLLLAAEAAELGNPAVITDAAVAALMARAAVRSAVYNVKINLNLISDQDYCSVLVERIAALSKKPYRQKKIFWSILIKFCHKVKFVNIERSRMNCLKIHKQFTF